MEYKDKRLPKGVSIWRNDFKEYVAIEFGRVAEFKKAGGYKAVSASRTIEGAIQFYLNKDTKHILEY